MSDFMHVPVLVKYDYESHAAAGALVGIGIDALLPKRMPRIGRLGIAVLSAISVGTAKEYVLDHHPHNREITPWGIGAAAALSFRYAF